MRESDAIKILMEWWAMGIKYPDAFGQISQWCHGAKICAQAQGSMEAAEQFDLCRKIAGQIYFTDQGFSQ